MVDMLPIHHMDDKDAYQWVSQMCPTCEVPPTKLLGRRGGAAHRQKLGVECEIWRCGRCGLIFPNPMPVPAKGLDQHYEMPPDDYFHHHDINEKLHNMSQLLQQAHELIGGTGSLLDVGAGRGELLLVARQQGWSVQGIEPSIVFADYAVRYSGVEVRRETIEDCGFPESSFDVVVVGGVLEHLYDPNETVKEIARVLRPGGVLFVDVPNEEGLYFRVGNLYQKLRMRNWVVNIAPTFSPFHTFGFGPRSLQALLSKHGLKPKRWRYYGGRSVLPDHGGLMGVVERLTAQAVSAASNIGSLGTYIETWAVKT